MVLQGRQAGVFSIAGSRYQIDVVNLTQDNLDTSAPIRAIRMLPTWW